MFTLGFFSPLVIGLSFEDLGEFGGGKRAKQSSYGIWREVGVGGK